MTVLDRDLVAAHREPVALVEVAHLLGERLEGAVGEDDAVAAEVRVVRRVTEVAAVAEVLAATGVGAPERLVREVPDEAALEQRLAVGEVDVLVDRPERVAHRVGVLAQDVGLVAVRREELLDLGGRRVHPRDDVGRLRVAAGPSGRLRSAPAGSPARRKYSATSQDAGAAERLVAARPHDDARVVLVPLAACSRRGRAGWAATRGGPRATPRRSPARRDSRPGPTSPCDSRFISSMTYRPYSSHSS